ncbi:MAG: hypothetical protein K1X56_04095 [Flavobacteriales bacterium]|nr:hypothetical protein [Flavobacteriales bacterium]
MKSIQFGTKDHPEEIRMTWEKQFRNVRIWYNETELGSYPSMNELSKEIKYILPDHRELSLRVNPVSLDLEIKVDGLIPRNTNNHPPKKLKPLQISIIFCALLNLLAALFSKENYFGDRINITVVYSAFSMGHGLSLILLHNGISNFRIIDLMIVYLNLIILFILPPQQNFSFIVFTSLLLNARLLSTYKKEISAYIQYLQQSQSNSEVIDS